MVAISKPCKNGIVDIKNIITLNRLPTPMPLFNQDGSMRINTANSSLKKRLKGKVNARCLSPTFLTIINGCP